MISPHSLILFILLIRDKRNNFSVGASSSSSESPFSSRFLLRNTNQQHVKHNSMLLQSSVHEYYSRSPHDTKLYDMLSVKSNATLAEIQKSWRRLSRDWHPDKVAVRRRRMQRSNKQSSMQPPPPPHIVDSDDAENIPPHPPPPIDDDDIEEYAKNKLQELTKAYEILSNDSTRLLYHKFGLIGGSNAAIQLLTGLVVEVEGDAGIANNKEQSQLMVLMGYPARGSWPSRQHNFIHHQRQRPQRLVYLTATITERLRPLVEGTVSQDVFVSDVYRECNSLKKVGLGAQILRCVGRAYRIEGYRVLRTMHHEKMTGRRIHNYRHYTFDRSRRKRRRRHAHHHEVADNVVDKARDLKQFALAALAQGKMVIMEQKIKKLEEQYTRQKLHYQKEKQERMDKEKVKRIQTGLVYDNIGSLSDGEEHDIDQCDDFDNILGAFSDDEEDLLRFLNDDDDKDNMHDELEHELHHEQNQKTYTALLSAHQMEALWKISKIELTKIIREACRCVLEESDVLQYDGWVDTTGRKVIPSDVGRLRAAAAMVLVGDIMVQSSKEGTSWNK